MFKVGLMLIFLGLSACSANQPIQIITGSTMGTTYQVKMIGGSVSKQHIEGVLGRVNQTFSTWDENSELSLLNAKPINRWIEVSDDLFFVLAQSKKIHAQTHGYFDPGIGRLIDVWGFGAVTVKRPPSPAQVSAALGQSSIQFLLLKDGKVKKTKDIQLNLSAIAKGFGVDAVARLLEQQHLQHFLIEIGGEVLTRGNNKGKDWVIGIEQPQNATPIALSLKNQSLATSGNYRHYFIWQGVRYMHILNANSGLPANSDLASVSVLHKQTLMADAYATAMMAMGSEKAITLAKQLNLSIVLIFNQQHDFNVVKINP